MATRELSLWSYALFYASGLLERQRLPDTVAPESGDLVMAACASRRGSSSSGGP